MIRLSFSEVSVRKDSTALMCVTGQRIIGGSAPSTLKSAASGSRKRGKADASPALQT